MGQRGCKVKGFDGNMGDFSDESEAPLSFRGLCDFREGGKGMSQNVFLAKEGEEAIKRGKMV